MNLLIDELTLLNKDFEKRKDQILTKLQDLTTTIRNLLSQNEIEFDKISANTEQKINDDADGNKKITLECLRCLRNAIVYNNSFGNPNIVYECRNLLEDICTLVTSQSGKCDRDDTVIKLCLQFLINSCVNNEKNARFIATKMSTVFPQLLSIKLNETGYLLNTILRQIPACVLELFKEQRHAEGTCNYDPSTFLLILENSDVESNLILLETLSSNKEFLNEIYTRLSVEKQLSYIKFLSSAMQHGHHKDIHLEFFANEFKLKSDIILKSDLQRLELEFLNIAALLELLSGASAKHEQLEQFQKDCSLVTTTMHLLQLTHQSSLFIPIEKLSKIQEEHKDHPGFLFKANLIRLLGNLTHKHRQNQDMIGESCLELILNCTKIDALNPFITQWSIWAIQNLLDGNQQNQSIVSNLTLTSTAYSETLEEFGLRTVIKDNVIRLERKPS